MGGNNSSFKLPNNFPVNNNLSRISLTSDHESNNNRLSTDKEPRLTSEQNVHEPCVCNCTSRSIQPIHIYNSPLPVNLNTGADMPGPFPELTKPAPDFSGIAVVDGQFKDIKLSDYKGKYLVLFFYPLDFTFVCPTEIISFSDRVEEFRAIGCEVVACSTDSHFSHLAWINTPRKEGGLGKMNIPLLADKNNKIAQDYGVYKEDAGVAFRGLFIIDENGRLRQITINDLPVGRSVDETLRLVQAFQFTDKHGEVCPAGWKPGDATMKPDPEGSKKYFSSH